MAREMRTREKSLAAMNMSACRVRKSHSSIGEYRPVVAEGNVNRICLISGSAPHLAAFEGGSGSVIEKWRSYGTFYVVFAIYHLAAYYCGRGEKERLICH